MKHPTAVISPEASIGDDVSIGPYAVIERDVEMGQGCRIEAHAILRNGTRLGRHVTIDSFSVIAGRPQDTSFDDEVVSYACIGDNTTVREGSTINRATRRGEATRVGNNCLLMAVSHVGHDCAVGDHVVMGNNVLLGGFVEIGNEAFLGGGAGVHQFCRVGRGVMFGGDSTATLDIPPFTMMSERNSLIGLNLVGLRRRGHDPAAVKVLKSCFHAVYGGGMSPGKTARQILEDRSGLPAEAVEFLRFFLDGKHQRGIARPRKAR